MSVSIREWARSQGLTVADRGLIPRNIVEEYKRAHGIGARDVQPAPVVQLPEPVVPMHAVRIEPVLARVPEPVAQVEDTMPRRSAALSVWLGLRSELEIIIDTYSPRDAAEHILLAGWMPTSEEIPG